MSTKLTRRRTAAAKITTAIHCEKLIEFEMYQNRSSAFNPHGNAGIELEPPTGYFSRIGKKRTFFHLFRMRKGSPQGLYKPDDHTLGKILKQVGGNQK